MEGAQQQPIVHDGLDCLLRHEIPSHDSNNSHLALLQLSPKSLYHLEEMGAVRAPPLQEALTTQEFVDGGPHTVFHVCVSIERYGLQSSVNLSTDPPVRRPNQGELVSYESLLRTRLCMVL